MGSHGYSEANVLVRCRRLAVERIMFNGHNHSEFKRVEVQSRVSYPIFSAKRQKGGASGNVENQEQHAFCEPSISPIIDEGTLQKYLIMFPFLDLPGEIRLIVYAHLLDPNEYVGGYRQIENLLAAETDRTRGPVCVYPRPHVECHTPPILLLNKLITMEALDALYKIPVTLYSTPSSCFSVYTVEITELISEHLLQRIRHAILRLDNASKHLVLPLLDIWSAANNLEKLDVYRPKQTPLPRQHWHIVKDRVCSPQVALEVPNAEH